MRIVVMGAGGVGGYFGARLAQGGCEVAFVARGAHLAALREQGLHVRSQHGDIHLEKVEASDDPASLGPADIVFITVKLWDTEAAAQAIRPLLGPAPAWSRSRTACRRRRCCAASWVTTPSWAASPTSRPRSAGPA